MPAKVKLEVTEGPVKGQKFEFDEHDTFVFGRDADCHACLPGEDKEVSRHHFILEANPPEAVVRDLGSLNGTWVNGKKCGGREKGETPEEGAQRRYPEVVLGDGDEIRVGRTVFKVRMESHAKPEPVRCKKCGKEVAKEIGKGRRGDYVCQSCRQKAEVDPVALLVEMLRQAGKIGRAAAPQIEGYEIEKRLGIGGFGAVYLARNKRSGMRAAIKVMLARVAVDAESREKFRREIESIKALRHPHIVEIIEHGAAGGAFYFVMEFCLGGSAADLMVRRGGKIPLAEAGRITLQALDGLAHAHARGFVHRDLKPHNILLAEAEGQWTAKIGDLGLAKSFEQAGLSGMTITGAHAGTPGFMPRDQIINFKFVKPTADVWSMGATLYNMLTGQLPMDFPSDKDPMRVVLDGTIVPIRQRDPKIPLKMAEVIDRALSKSPRDRHADAAQMREALEKVL